MLTGASAPARRADPAPAAAMLALRRSAGNRAVSGMLARDKDEKAPDDTATATNTTSQLGDLGVIPLVRSRAAPGRRSAGLARSASRP
jgi:hypothetical protein